MQLDAWWQQLPKMWSLWRNWVIFLTFCDRFMEVISLVTLKNLQFSAKIDYFWVGVDATRCLKAEIAKNVFILTILFFFLLFCDRVIKASSFCPTKKFDFFSANFNCFWVGMDATRCLMAKTAKNVFTLKKLGDFTSVLRSSHWSYFFGHPQKIATFGKNWLFYVRVIASRCLKAEIDKKCSFWRILVTFPLFCDRVTKVSSFWPPINFCTFRQKMTISG